MGEPKVEAVDVICGDELVASKLEELLHELGVPPAPGAPHQLLVDKPLGWASLPHETVDFRHCIVLSDNLCPTYRLDLLDRQPAALIPFEPEIVAATLLSVRHGHRVVPEVRSPLTTVERKTLRLVAQGLSNKEIARRRDVSERTVKNNLYEIYQKLELRSRVQAAHYYFGNWHLLVGWRPPEAILPQV